MEGRVWRNRSGRVIGWGWQVVMVGCGLSLVLSPDLAWWGAVLVVLVFGGIGVVGWAVWGATDLAFRDGRVVVRNPFRTVEVPVAAVERIEPGQQLSLHLRSGEVVRVWSVQAANVSLLLRRRSHVDRVAEELRDLVASTPRVDRVPQVVERSPAARAFAVAVAFAALATGIVRLVVQG